MSSDAMGQSPAASAAGTAMDSAAYASLQESARDHLWMHFTRHSSYEQHDVPVIVRGEGPYVWDAQGKRYLDALAGLFVNQLGHGRTELAPAAAVGVARDADAIGVAAVLVGVLANVHDGAEHHQQRHLPAGERPEVHLEADEGDDAPGELLAGHRQDAEELDVVVGEQDPVGNDAGEHQWVEARYEMETVNPAQSQTDQCAGNHAGCVGLHDANAKVLLLAGRILEEMARGVRAELFPRSLEKPAEHGLAGTAALRLLSQDVGMDAHHGRSRGERRLRRLAGLQVLGQLSQSVEVYSPELATEREAEADATPCLRFAPHAGAWLVQAGVRPFGKQGRFFVAGTGRATLSYFSGGERLRCERDFERERAGVDALVAACPTLASAVEGQDVILHVAGLVAAFLVVVTVDSWTPSGHAPSGKDLEVVKRSDRYKTDHFENWLPRTEPEFFPMLARWLKGAPNTVPTKPVPFIELHGAAFAAPSPVGLRITWLGHSTSLVEIDGDTFLIDPVWGERCSPLSFMGPARFHPPPLALDQLPTVNAVVISHDHYDHLDYQTIMKLKPKIKQVICGLGVGEHFEYWKFDSAKIIEKDWNESVVVGDNFTLHTASARHFSGRSFIRNNTLWLSFVLQTPNLKLYLGGDSGYDTHFVEIGEKFGGFDLAVLDNGQYNLAWQAIHLLPHEGLKAAKDLQAKRLFPVHSSKFKLANHPWDEPLKTISELNEKEHHFSLVTPKIGEIVNLNDSTQTFTKWWENID